MHKRKSGFGLVEVMMGMAIGSFALVTLFSALQHLTRTTQKSILQGNSLQALDEKCLDSYAEKKQVDMGQQVEEISSASELKEYAETLKRMSISSGQEGEKERKYFVFVPLSAEKEKGENA